MARRYGSLAFQMRIPLGHKTLLNFVQLSVETSIRETLGLGELEVNRANLLRRIAYASSYFTRYIHLKYLYDGTEEPCLVKSGVCLFVSWW